MTLEKPKRAFGSELQEREERTKFAAGEGKQCGPTKGPADPHRTPKAEVLISGRKPNSKLWGRSLKFSFRPETEIQTLEWQSVKFSFSPGTELKKLWRQSLKLSFCLET